MATLNSCIGYGLLLAYTFRQWHRPIFSVKKIIKEVIQPHVLVRLPCYDFTPITSHNLGPEVFQALLLHLAFVV